jgi:hypothetical protein
MGDLDFWAILKKQQGNPRVALPNLTLNKHHQR